MYRHSHGIPRLINTVCENALISAFAQQLHNVPPHIIDEVAYDLRLGTTVPPRAGEQTATDEALRAREGVRFIV